MRFFARIVFICNIAFIASAILRFVEIKNSAKGNANLALKFQPVESTLVVLGYGAIFSEVTTDVAVGQMRQLEFVADEEGDWAFHCHKSHHTMNPMEPLSSRFMRL